MIIMVSGIGLYSPRAGVTLVVAQRNVEHKITMVASVVVSVVFSVVSVGKCYD